MVSFQQVTKKLYELNQETETLSMKEWKHI
jgi:hypothetical protein